MGFVERVLIALRHMAAGGKTTFARAANFQVKSLGGDKMKQFYTFCVFLQEGRVAGNCLTLGFLEYGKMQVVLHPRILKAGMGNK